VLCGRKIIILIFLRICCGAYHGMTMERQIEEIKIKNDATEPHDHPTGALRDV
jgi:hypothetical protein